MRTLILGFAYEYVWKNTNYVGQFLNSDIH